MHVVYGGTQQWFPPKYIEITLNANLYLCDFARRCPLSFRLNTGIARVQASVAGKKTQGACSLARCQQRAQAQTYARVGGWLVLCENQGGKEGRFCHFG